MSIVTTFLSTEVSTVPWYFYCDIDLTFSAMLILCHVTVSRLLVPDLSQGHLFPNAFSGLTDQKLGNVFDAKRKNGDGLGLSPNACVGGYLGLRPSVQSMSNILNLFPGFSLFLPGNEVMGFSEPNLWYTLVVYHLHGQTGQFHLPENGREGLKLVSKNGTRISVCNIPAGKTGAFQMFRCSRKFSVGQTEKVVFYLLSNRISRKIVVNGKQPLSSVTCFCNQINNQGITSRSLYSATFRLRPVN